MKTTHLLKTALAGAAALLAVCSGPDISAPVVSVGSLSFSYTGDRAGTFSARGQILRRNRGFAHEQFAAGFRVTEGGTSALSVISYQPVTSTRGHAIVFGIFQVNVPGSYPMHAAGCTANCPRVGLLFETNRFLVAEPAQSFVFTSGTLNVTSMTADRMAGTFSGTAESISGESAVTVTNGTFDIAVIKDRFQLPATARASLPARNAGPE